MFSQSKGQTVPQFVCSIGKCSDSKMCFVVFLVDAGDGKTRYCGGLQVRDSLTGILGKNTSRPGNVYVENVHI